MREFMNEESGQGMVEYGLIIALISVAIIAALKLVANNLKIIFNNVAANLST